MKMLTPLFLCRSVLPSSPQMFPLIALNLLRLLSQNRLSDFHTALETIDPEQLQSNAYIKQAVDLGKHFPSPMMVMGSC